MPVISNPPVEKGTKGEERASCSVRSRKRKADVAIYLQDPDETLDCLEMTKKKQYQDRGPWSNEMICKSPHKLIPTPEKEEHEQNPTSYPHFASLRFSPVSVSPLPRLGWANQDDVWRNMLNKDRTYLRDKNFFQKHPQLQPNMRAILLDWLMEVCEVYKLHRETFYLGQDFFDRFMATQKNVIKSRLQLIGITSLFIAAKLEEIYPPKLHQFAFITDGACTEDEITSMELIIMKDLDWCLSPMTVVSWFNVFLQVAYIRELQHFLLPQFPQEVYIQIVQLLDLCVLDICCLEYPYGVLAASALYHFSCPELVEKVSGFKLTELQGCIKWLVPFAMAIKDGGKSKLKFFKGVDIEDVHNIQMHTGCLELMKRSQGAKKKKKFHATAHVQKPKEKEERSAHIHPWWCSFLLTGAPAGGFRKRFTSTGLC